MRILLSLILLSFSQCSSGSLPSSGPSSEPDTKKVDLEREARHRARLLEIARQSKDYALVDSTLNWAPALCSAPPRPGPRMSRSSDEQTHGRKLYSLRTDNLKAYEDLSETQHPGLVIKETWRPRELESLELIGGEGFLDRDGKTYGKGERGPLFIMFYDSEEEHWIYGTVLSDLQTVTGAGRMRSCIRCHREAQHHELFGLSG